MDPANSRLRKTGTENCNFKNLEPTATRKNCASEGGSNTGYGVWARGGYGGAVHGLLGDAAKATTPGDRTGGAQGIHPAILRFLDEIRGRIVVE